MPSLLHRGDVLGVIAEGEECAVDLRVERFDAAVHHFRKPVTSLTSVTATPLSRSEAPCRRSEDLDAVQLKVLGKLNDARFIRNAY